MNSSNGLRLLCLIIHCCCFFVIAHSQNLVPNGSFEDMRDCPSGLTQFPLVNHWYSPTGGSPDLFATCKSAKKHTLAPRNEMGYQNPNTGNAYAGLILSDQMPQLVEYIQVRLTQHLQSGISYQFSMYVSLANVSQYGLRSVDVHLSEISVKRAHWEPIPVLPSLNLQTDRALNDTLNWIRVSGIYVANGDEQYLTIGNFNPDNNRGGEDVNTSGRNDILAYYYIDDVSLEPMVQPDDFNILPVITELPWQTHPVYFHFNKWEVLSESAPVLDSLVKYMQSRPGVSIELSGHTDGKGSMAYNMSLSEKRTKSITNYFAAKGISNDRLHYKWYGLSKPTASNKSEDGRRLNRRVEVKVLQ